ncbi:ABC transporter ATP-binding protein [Nocardioides sp. TRM66260-LWL]|uniref:ABC transporter ATP-binding protein n=1 Tax=Nocardioides sp. TRM66260-LWL TaxID=2874478 RepID=UPI001CC5F141|nr:ABC transporter ATP-binding protein [Nocardioides sp. TRM66260-LWL]MBZ5733912.1 ABC transporter ATP-binding protein [Nocardioides sp. TRM66260-LWL]
MTTPAIEASGLVKAFGATRALDGLELTVAAGEVHGFLGPNGAGKSTTIRALLGMLRLDRGTLRLLGSDPWRDATSLHARLAYVPGDVALWPRLTGGEVIDLLLRARGLEPARTDRDVLVERFGLDPSKRCRTYSKGNRQKVALVAAFAAPVELLVLDEPTSGLDPLVAEVFAACVREHVDAGAAVLLSSHVLGEVDHLAERVTIIRAGRTVTTGRLDELRHLHRTRVRARLPEGVEPRLPAGVELDRDGAIVRLSVEPAALPAVLGALAEAGVTELTAAPPSLEELFLDAYRPPA